MLARRPGFRARLLSRWGQALIDRINSAWEAGTVEGILPDGSYCILGGRGPGPVVKVELRSWWAFVRLVNSGSVGWYEAWAKGEWTSPDPVPLFDLFMRNRAGLGRLGRASGVSRLVKRLGHFLRRNTRAGAKQNILAHYDLGNDFYREWLDSTMSYSSAIFAEPISPEESLEAAQTRKVDRLLARLKLEPGSEILEIGCGWGYLSRACAEAGHQVSAITLSPSQKAWAERAGGGAAVDYRLCDYRDVTGQYDGIVSVEMVEAVGQRYWPVYLDVIARSLKPGGRAAIQYIAIADDIFEAYSTGVDFIQAYIFPGGMLLSESRFRALAEVRGLSWEAAEHFPLHYAETLRRWREAFDRAIEEGRLPQGFDQRFVDLWRYYLMYCEGGFRGGGITVGQVTLVKGHSKSGLD
jgi:cyclopropane-fatty-acyl-phospholipid synthase